MYNICASVYIIEKKRSLKFLLLCDTMQFISMNLFYDVFKRNQDLKILTHQTISKSILTYYKYFFNVYKYTKKIKSPDHKLTKNLL